MMIFAYLPLNVLQGSHIFQKLRPVDQLRHLLVSCAGGESEEIERFFKLHRVFLLFITPSFHGFVYLYSTYVMLTVKIHC